MTIERVKEAGIGPSARLLVIAVLRGFSPLDHRWYWALVPHPPNCHLDWN
jgi:hypothetical protein